MQNFIFRSKSQGRSGMKRSRRMESLWNRSSRPNLTAYYPERRLKIPSNARNRSVRNPRRLCACGARSSRQGVAKEKKTAEEERIRGERGEVCGSVAPTHRRNRSLSLSLPPSLPPSLSVDAVDRPAWYSVLVPRHNWPPTGDAPPGIAKTRNYSLINCQRSMWPHA